MCFDTNDCYFLYRCSVLEDQDFLTLWGAGMGRKESPRFLSVPGSIFHRYSTNMRIGNYFWRRLSCSHIILQIHWQKKYIFLLLQRLEKIHILVGFWQL